MKYIKTFENYSQLEVTNEELFGLGKKVYVLDEYKPSEKAVEYVAKHPAAKVCIRDFKTLYKKKFNQDLSDELTNKCVQVAYDFGGAPPQLGKYGFEFNPKDEKKGGKVTLTVDPNGKGLFSGHPIMG